MVCACFGESSGRYVFAACGEDTLVFVKLRASCVVLVLSGRVQNNTSFVVLRRVFRRDYSKKRLRHVTQLSETLLMCYRTPPGVGRKYTKCLAKRIHYFGDFNHNAYKYK